MKESFDNTLSKQERLRQAEDRRAFLKRRLSDIATLIDKAETDDLKNELQDLEDTITELKSQVSSDVVSFPQRPGQPEERFVGKAEARRRFDDLKKMIGG